MLTTGINFKNFKKKNKKLKFEKKLKFIADNRNQILISLSKNYKDNFDKKTVNKYKKASNFRLIGMGGSILGAEAIHNFLEFKIKKKVYFFNNLDEKKIIDFKNKLILIFPHFIFFFINIIFFVWIVCFISSCQI